MITVNNLSFHFGGQTLFKNVDLKFTPGNCYGIIGANGAGKSTFFKLLCGELEPATGEVFIPDTVRMSVLKQDHFAYEEYTVLDTIIMGNMRLYEIMKEKDALYAKEDFTEDDGLRASDLEAKLIFNVVIDGSLKGALSQVGDERDGHVGVLNDLGCAVNEAGSADVVGKPVAVHTQFVYDLCTRVYHREVVHFACEHLWRALILGCHT